MMKSMDRFTPYMKLVSLSSVVFLGAQSVVTIALAKDNFSVQQKQDIIQIVRQALIRDPTILEDAISTLQSKMETDLQNKTKEALEKNRSSLAGLPQDVILGNPKGDMTVVEFYDPRCPVCHKMQPILRQLVNDNKNVRIVMKVIPVLGPNSETETRAILAANRQGKDKTAQLMDLFMTEPGATTDNRIKTLAQKAGLDPKKLLQDMKEPELSKLIDQNLAIFHDLKATGTPTFVFNNSFVVPGGISLNQMKSVLATVKK